MKKMNKIKNLTDLSPPPLLFVISGPSGSGKGTALDFIDQNFKDVITRNPTYTTRKPRKGEKQGKEYNFVSKTCFENLVAQGAIFEFTRTYSDELYGSPSELVETATPNHLVVELDYNGFYRVRALSRRQIVSIFVMPPTIKALSDRIESRQLEKNLSQRLEIARKQMSHAWSYNYVLINENRSSFLEQLHKVIFSEVIRWDGIRHLTIHWRSLDSTL